jgi:hypothetical protein
MSSATEKLRRAEHANELIKIIAAHGRRFFHYSGSNVFDPETKVATFVLADRVAYIELRRGRVYFVDAYSQQAVFTHKTNFGGRWRGFSGGGTLRSLVEDMRDYIIDGTPIPRWKIVIQQLGHNDLVGNIWGYDVAAAQAVRAAAYTLPIIAPEPMPLAA